MRRVANFKRLGSVAGSGPGHIFVMLLGVHAHDVSIDNAGFWESNRGLNSEEEDEERREQRREEAVTGVFGRAGDKG